MKKKKTIDVIASIDDFDSLETDCWSSNNATPGNTICSFSFDEPKKTNSPIKTIVTKNEESKSTITSLSDSQQIHDNRTNSFANGITPPIDGESLNIRRTYLLRSSTIKKINELVAAHPDINVYVSTIVDTAINYYYDYIINQGGSQK